jgi:hypothetical protein
MIYPAILETPLKREDGNKTLLNKNNTLLTTFYYISLTSSVCAYGGGGSLSLYLILKHNFKSPIISPKKD